MYMYVKCIYAKNYAVFELLVTVDVNVLIGHFKHVT